MIVREQLATFSLNNVPTLDVVVEGALELFCDIAPPTFTTSASRLLVLGSGNAAALGNLLYRAASVQFGNEATYRELIERGGFDEVVVISASGSKHAVAMVEAGVATGKPVTLVTNNSKAPAAERLSAECVKVYPKNREPYTYNTSTYLGPLLAKTGESPAELLEWLRREVSAKLLRNFADFASFTFIFPDDQAPVCDMVKTKFDELFGGKVTGRAFTESEIMHAKTVVVSGDELFISLGVTNEHYGLAKNRLSLPLPSGADSAAFMSISYFMVGYIQRAFPPYFAQNIEQYCKTASQLFGHRIEPIVEGSSAVNKYHNDVTVVDEKGVFVASLPYPLAKESGYKRAASRIMLFNNEGKVLITKRSKYVSKPLLYDNSAAGHVDAGETYDEAAYRELLEELGISDLKLHLVVENLFEQDFRSNIYTAIIDGNASVMPDETEIDSVYWWTTEELEERISSAPEEFSPSLIEFWAKSSATILKKYYELRSV